MSKYFRITAYNKGDNISVIMDSNGKFNEIWEFSSYMIQKGFSILEVGKEPRFTDGNIPRANYDEEHIILRAAQYGEPTYETINNQKTVKVKNRYYIPEINY